MGGPALAIEQFPPLALRPIDLDPEGVDFVVRGPEAPKLRDRVEFGGPLVTSIDASYRPDDADLQAFIKGQAGKLRFSVAHMSINFPVSYPPPLTAASVQVTLADDGGTGQTVAYSLFPTHAGPGYDVTKGFTISPKLTIGPIGAELGDIVGTTVTHSAEDYVMGGPELSAHPAWTFARTTGQDLSGATRLVMIVQVPVGRTGMLTVDLAAEVEMGRFRKSRIPLSGADQVNPAVVRF